jgi:hypothetical protein
MIKIPTADEQVKIHEPEQFAGGGKDAKGRPVLKPIARSETKANPVVFVGIAAAVVVAFAVAFVLKKSELSTSPIFLGVCGTVLAPPLVLGGYTFLRNQELEPYRGKELFLRAAICSAAYALMWGAMWGLKHFLVGEGGSEILSMAIVAAPPAIIGSLAALGTLDLDFGSGFFHYVLYLGTCVLLRLTMGLKPL